jgi:hypothetical protein
MERIPSTASIVGILLFLMLSTSAPALSADLTLAWDPNNEQNLDGYGVYISSGSSGPPYDLFGFVQLSELEDPDSPSFVVTGLTPGARYAIALTAYDVDGKESPYSSPVCVEIGVGQVQCAPLSSSPAPSSGSGGGGGGGVCFIASAAAGNGVRPWVGVVLAFSSAVLLCLNNRFRR